MVSGCRENLAENTFKYCQISPVSADQCLLFITIPINIHGMGLVNFLQASQSIKVT